MATGRVPTTANSPLTAKGDLFGYSTTQARVAVGSDGDTLVANSAAATGLSYKEDYAAGKNRIVNGAMTIDQRNAGASVSVTTAGIYTLDRWKGFSSGGGVYSVQRDSSAPAGFSNSLKVTVTTAATSLASTDNYSIAQEIEGYNVADFALGSASAKTFTLSFWVRSSLTGTFGGSFKNEDNNRSYPFTYSISVADTWEKKSITIEGVTSGTWNKTTGQGLRLFMAFGTGASRRGTAGVWGNDNYTGATGQTQIIETLNATWYITGVQVEIGSVATAFTPAAGTIQGELAACQRYYYRNQVDATLRMFGNGWNGTTTVHYGFVPYPVTMRIRPTALEQSGTAAHYQVAHANTATVCSVVPTYGTDTTEKGGAVQLTVASGLTAGQGGAVYSANASAYLGWSAEL